jgi:hypothetical protein
MSDPVSLGEIKPTPGTPLTIAENFPAFAHELINTIYLQVLPGNVGDVYFGRENLDKTTRLDLIAILRPPTANHLPDLAFNIPDSMNPFMVSAYRVDVDTLNDGVRISFIQR